MVIPITTTLQCCLKCRVQDHVELIFQPISDKLNIGRKFVPVDRQGIEQGIDLRLTHGPLVDDRSPSQVDPATGFQSPRVVEVLSPCFVAMRWDRVEAAVRIDPCIHRGDGLSRRRVARVTASDDHVFVGVIAVLHGDTVPVTHRTCQPPILQRVRVVTGRPSNLSAS